MGGYILQKTSNKTLYVMGCFGAPMTASNKKAEQKQKMVRVVAIVACCALLLTAILPYIASSLLR